MKHQNTQHSSKNNMMSILIDDIPCLCIIGIHAHERTNEQPLFVSAQLWGDFIKAAQNCRIEDTVDYSVLQNDFILILKEAKFRLLETAVYVLCEWSLWRNSNAKVVQISIKKPHALSGKGIPCVSTTLSRRKGLKKTPFLFESNDVTITTKISKKLGMTPRTTRVGHLSDGQEIYFFEKLSTDL